MEMICCGVRALGLYASAYKVYYVAIQVTQSILQFTQLPLRLAEVCVNHQGLPE
jgi:hypothetical protein